MDDISVLICDDSALMRNLIGRIVDDYEGLKVAGKAENGQDLLNKIPELKPDVILLDIEMPVMNGVEFLKERKARKIDIPVIILSSIATEGAAVTMQCLDLGASDFITKPGGSSVTLKISDVSNEIVEYIAAYGGAYANSKGKQIPDPDYFHHQIKLKEAERFVIQKKGEEAAKANIIKKTDLTTSSLWSAPKKKEPVNLVPEREGGKIDLIAIGISTGGPNALREVFKMIDPHLKQPILVVQHMPAGFTQEFAASLNNICPLTVTEAKDGEPIVGGHVYIAPGGYHMLVEDRALGKFIKLNQEDQRNGHRPSVDVLFESVAGIYKNHALGVIMTGMGKDGAAQLAEMRKKGAWTLGQDQESCIVYGMPKVAFEMGGVQKQVPLKKMADEISALAREHLTK
ncbi:MAG: chemotaxis response regulator protein-glutamate methylesterase [Treponema sp.]|nr:chemotaxis response regulator protein-glutamate methylesterase [Spirochaetia bacterium]MDY2840517.1 chemotaxis response regulator protein-glutamate methylesterase [Treponema sp.]MDY5123860.1 chemotaxis response regulator protein-glutamate methylesterase [Treponema sp.]